MRLIIKNHEFGCNLVCKEHFKGRRTLAFVKLMDVCDNHIGVTDAGGVASIPQDFTHKAFRYPGARVEEKREFFECISWIIKLKVVFDPFTNNGVGNKNQEFFALTNLPKVRHQTSHDDGLTASGYNIEKAFPLSSYFTIMNITCNRLPLMTIKWFEEILSAKALEKPLSHQSLMVIQIWELGRLRPESPL